MAENPLSSRTRAGDKRNGSLSALQFAGVTGEEIQALLDDRAAKGVAGEESAIFIFSLTEELIPCHVGGGALPETAWRGVQPCGDELKPAFAMKLVRTALAHDVDYSAHRARVFGFEAGGLDLDFAEEFERDRVVVSERATANVGNFNAVNDEGVFRAARAIDLEASDAEVTGLGFSADAGGHDKDGVEVPALRRVFNKFLGDVGRGLAGGNVNRF